MFTMQLNRIFLILLVWVSASGAAFPYGPIANKATLMLDSGGHMATINQIIFTPDGKYLISGGEDKVIRIWDLAARNTLGTIRGPIGNGFPGMINDLALSPSGRMLAVAFRETPSERRDHAIWLPNFLKSSRKT